MLFDEEIDDLRLGRIKRSDPSPLHRAVRKFENIKVRKLLDEGVDANMTNDLGETPLLYAIKTENLKAAEMLIKHGVDLEKRDIAKFTALGYALLTGHKDIIDLLLEYGADVNKRQGKDCKEPLLLACKEFEYYFVQVLFHFGARVDSYEPYQIYNFINITTRSADLFMTYGFTFDYVFSKRCSYNFNYICRYIALRGTKQEIWLKNKHESYYKECIKELEKMKMVHLDERISSYDYVKASRNQLINYSKNKNLCDKLGGLLKYRRFTIYQNMLKINSVIGIRYGRIYDKVSLDDFAGRYSLPILVRDNVLQYLNERDINNFIKAQS